MRTQRERSEEDFAKNIESIIATDPNADGWVIVADNLNTHMSETLVKFVAEQCGVEGEGFSPIVWNIKLVLHKCGKIWYDSCTGSRSTSFSSRAGSFCQIAEAGHFG